jgi:hypothetical protein
MPLRPTVCLSQRIRVQQISWDAAQLVDDFDAQVAREMVHFFCVWAFSRSLAVCKESVISKPLAACSVLPREPRFWAAWLD